MKAAQSFVYEAPGVKLSKSYYWEQAKYVLFIGSFYNIN